MTDNWIELLSARCTEIGVAATARELGYSRAAVSMARAGKYPAGIEHISAAVIRTYSQCDCPYLGVRITAADCRRNRSRPMPMSKPEALRFWTACRGCPIGRRLADVDAQAGGALPASAAPC